MSQVLLYVTAATPDEAVRIGRCLVDEHLAACANVLRGMTSIYRWEGEVRTDGEAVLILKTTSERQRAATERVKSLHSYACPCVAVLPIAGGNPDFLAWIERETQPA